MSDTVKSIGVVLRPSTPELRESYLDIKNYLQSHDIETALDSRSAHTIGLSGVPFEQLCKDVDILVSIGGDGTLISTVRRSYKYGIPVLGIYAGRLGFLADLSLDDFYGFVHNLKTNGYRIDKRAMLEAHIIGDEGEKRVIAFNDIVITRPSISKMITLHTFVDTKAFNTYFGDGLIISTPTGSTAYNLSAGGPVLFPLTNVFALTPICAHSLTQRPVVLPGEYEIEVKTPDKSALVIVDGQNTHEFGVSDKMFIRLAKESARLIHKKEFSYFDVLRQKLNWGN